MDTMHDSLLTVGNGGNKPAKAELTILYNQGSEQYQVEQMLAPDEQMLVDFGKLIRNQVPDKNGHVLPPELTSGAYRLRDLEHNPLGALYEGKVIVDKTYGHAAYGCGVCCGPDAPTMAFDPLAVSIDDYADQYIQALNSCGGGVQDFTDDFSTWWTGDTAIATANKNSIHGVAAGTTNHYAQSDPMYWGIRKAFNICPVTRPQTTAGTNVAPQIISIIPATGQAGGTSAVSISGSGFGTSPTVNIAPAGVEVSGVTASQGGTVINAAFAIPSGATVGAYSVTVSVPNTDGGGTQTSNAATFTVTACASITSFQRKSWNPIPTTGELDISYTWGSSTGKLSDLKACQQSEYVTYPGNPGTYTWPRPPFGQTSANPTSVGGNASNGAFTDKHLPPASWVKPYIPASFTANQTYQYVCPCVNSGNQNTLAQYTITRSVTQNTDGTFKYTVTKSSGESAGLNPLP